MLHLYCAPCVLCLCNRWTWYQCQLDHCTRRSYRHLNSLPARSDERGLEGPLTVTQSIARLQHRVPKNLGEAIAKCWAEKLIDSKQRRAWDAVREQRNTAVFDSWCLSKLLCCSDVQAEWRRRGNVDVGLAAKG